MKDPLPRLRPFKFTGHRPDVQGTVIVDGRRATRQVLKLLPEHRNKTTWGCGTITLNDIERDRYVIVDHYDHGDIIDYIVDTQPGLRELKRFSVKPGVRAVIELTLDGSESHIIEAIEAVLDAGTLQTAIQGFDPQKKPIHVRSARCIETKQTMIQRTA